MFVICVADIGSSVRHFYLDTIPVEYRNYFSLHQLLINNGEKDISFYTKAFGANRKTLLF